MKILGLKNAIYLKGATSYEFQLGTLEIRFLFRDYWMSSNYIIFIRKWNTMDDDAVVLWSKELLKLMPNWIYRLWRFSRTLKR